MAAQDLLHKAQYRHVDQTGDNENAWQAFFNQKAQSVQWASWLVVKSNRWGFCQFSSGNIPAYKGHPL
jgi:hypothetical protein